MVSGAGSSPAPGLMHANGDVPDVVRHEIVMARLARESFRWSIAALVTSILFLAFAAYNGLTGSAPVAWTFCALPHVLILADVSRPLRSRGTQPGLAHAHRTAWFRLLVGLFAGAFVCFVLGV